MIYTVLGPIAPDKLGTTLMHEHIMLDYHGADDLDPTRYQREEVVETMLPYLLKLRGAGCDTFVDATPEGSGRDVLVLQECARRSGLNFITATGTFKGKGVPMQVRTASIDEIAAMWVKEFKEGIGGTGGWPGLIKIALDDGDISPLQEKILRAAARASLETGLAIQSHTLNGVTIRQAAQILTEEKLPFQRFIWAHADCDGDLETMLLMGQRQMWLQLDGIGYAPYEKQVRLIQELIRANLLDRILLSQDRGWYVVGPDKGRYVNPYHPILTEFVPLCKKAGIGEDELHQMLVVNPARALDVADGV